MEASFEKNMFGEDFPFRLFLNEGIYPSSHHWHDEIEIIYMTQGSVKVGINKEMYTLNEGDILLISSGEVHYFLPEYGTSNRMVIQFNLSIFDSLTPSVSEKKEIKPIFHRTKRLSSDWDPQVKTEMERHIKDLFMEYNQKKEGYRLALRARLYDLVVLLIRRVPMETITHKEESKQTEILSRLDTVFQYVENNYASDISLESVSLMAGYSVYHFTRFFKNSTGMTFGQYLSNFRITKAEWFLLNKDYNITEIAYKCGFNSVKTFNRIFKCIKKQSPSEYRKAKFEKDIAMPGQ